ncbi:spermine synthase [Thermosulfurimonas sp. F29]|uniref:spermine/spermidine synthase domain-containing protein n=1 Tax=Thermosulfurimonas sp. F29 TaxID=2867247 RepID=UPI001C82ED3C|nr:spermine synthase [Thermosulfurimonas sp. F29]MBX6423979.1 spermine synthase [Thermosulfurimonas sp. F29]
MTRYWWRESLGRDYGHAYRVGLIYEERTPAGQHLQVFHNPFWGRFVVLDGIVQFTERDEFVYHETIVYTPAAALAGAPETILIVGGGDGGVLREVQKLEGVKRILQAELDLSVFEVCQKYLRDLSGDYEDPRVEFMVRDGLAAVSELPGESFDLVIVDCTDPVGPARTLYTEEFYRGVLRILKPEGLFIQQASLPGFFPDILRRAWRLASGVFPRLAVLRAMVPCYGDEIAFLMGGRSPELDFEPKRRFVGRHYSPEMHRASFALPEWWRREILYL